MKTVLLLLLLCPVVLWAQMFKISPDDTQRKHSYVVMRDGSVVRGQVLRQDSTVISIRKGNGDMTFVEADQVIRISPNRPDYVDNQVSSDESSTIFILKDGTRLPGTFVRRDNTMITVRKRNGQLTYFEPELLMRVDTVRETAGQSISGEPAFVNRFSPFLLVNPTAFNPEKGHFYYRNTLLLVNEVDYGITKNWSVGLSTNPIINQIKAENSAKETVLGANVRLFSRLTFPIGDQFRFGVNAIYQPRQSGNYFSVTQQVVVQGLMSFGNSQRNATLGYSMRMYPDYTGRNKTTYITAGVMHKISGSLTILSDNSFYLASYLGGTSAELSIAMRFDRRRHAFDLGAFSSIQPYYTYTIYQSIPTTRAYFYPYLAYNLIIGSN